MRELHIALVQLSPLLADLIHQSLVGTIPYQIDAVIEKGAEPARSLSRIDVVIIGGSQVDTGVPAINAKNAQVLSISPDLTQIDGPGSGDRTAFTTANLVAALRRIADDLDP